MKRIKNLLLLAVVVVIASCSSEESSVTGWKYNDSKWGGFEVADYVGQQTGPNLVMVEGGTFMMGNTEQDVMYKWDHIPRRVTVQSFYIDQTEVANVHYREYLYWTRRVFGADYPEIYRRSLPDTLVWRDELAYNEPYVEYYLRHPAYNYYPIVGVNWLQANEFCKWRSDRVNELMLIADGYLELNPNQVNEDNFNTKAYLVGQYEGMIGKEKEDLDPNGSGTRKIGMQDGIMMPDYRLPTEAEWEYAALALIGNQPYEDEERVTDRRIYPWSGTSLRYSKHGGWQGEFLANFKRGRGDNMGVAGKLNDNAMITAPVDAFLPNDFGIYNMAGNVSEWVMDVYRPLTNVDANDFNSFRGNVFMAPELDSDGIHVEKDSMGRVKYRKVTDEESANRVNYKTSDVRNYEDGDENSEVEYEFGVRSLVSDKARVYKGGSWDDRAWYLSPGARRFLDEDQSRSTIGFRCAMDRVGSPSGNDFKGGNNFRKR